jgi:hypothetical protein
MASDQWRLVAQNRRTSFEELKQSLASAYQLLASRQRNGASVDARLSERATIV